VFVTVYYDLGNCGRGLQSKMMKAKLHAQFKQVGDESVEDSN
jgi:hypothetical protein